MSYSFDLKASSKAAAKRAVVERMCMEVGRQPVHAKDVVQVCVAAHALIDLLPDDDTRDVSVSMAGSLSGQWEGGELLSVTGVNSSISVHLAPHI